jgi:hypothetical protein
MTSPTHYGATPDEWSILADVAGMTADMLPVVSNPGARVSPDSKLKALGKVPSLFNSAGEAVGIAKWTAKVSTVRDIDRWCAQPDLGICLQTRVVRALDVDIDDADIVARIVEIASRHLGHLPTRSRGDSAKCLLAFTLSGNFTKRILRTASGAIEFLATGQQFVACGTHPKGARYEWVEGTPYDFPTVSVEAFEACWAELMHNFATEEVVVVGEGRALREARRQVDVEDDVAQFLYDKGWVLSESRDGRLNITCPFEHEHSGPSADDTATQYMPKGVGGFELGHFSCLHAHCANRNDGDFVIAIGAVAEQFDIVEVPEGEAEDPAEMPMFLRNPESGKILTNLRNAMMGLRAPAWCGVDIAHDQFRDELMLTPAGKAQWRAFRDADYARLRLQLEGKGLALGVELLKEVVGLRADENRFDSARMWLEQEVPAWDGVDRIESFYPRVFGAADTPYARAVGLYTWTAMAGRVLDPGCKADMVPILRGEQGLRKSSAVAAMAPSHEFFAELDLSARDDDMSRLMRGKLIAELGELKGLHNREVEAVKAFITRRHEQWVPKYREFATTFPRRLLFIGTTNRHEFLADDTGSRRWLPLECAGVDVGADELKADVGAVERDRLQLWAEARERWTACGVMWEDAERLAKAEHEHYRISDSWEEVVREWLNDFDDLDAEGDRAGGRNGDRPLRSHDILVGALRLDPKGIKRGDEMRLGSVLAALGYERKVRSVEGRNAKVWVKGEAR